MSVGKVRKQPSRNTGTNLSHTLDGNRNKPNYNHTSCQQHTALNNNILQ